MTAAWLVRHWHHDTICFWFMLNRLHIETDGRCQLWSELLCRWFHSTLYSQALTFPHTSIKRKVFVFVGAPCYSGNYSCWIPTGESPKVMQWGQIFIIVPDTFKTDSHFVNSNVPKIRFQSVFFGLALKVKSETCWDCVQVHYEANLRHHCSLALTCLSLQVSTLEGFLYAFMTSCNCKS